MNDFSHRATWAYGSAMAALILFMYLPMITMALASFSRSKYFSFPVPKYSDKWYLEVFQSLSIRDFFWTSTVVAIAVACLSTVLAFFGALAFARYDWKGRRLFQKIILLPILFPQAVLGLALLLWFTALGITPSWQATVFAHLVWIAPIATLVIAIQVYSFDPAVEEAAYDLGASRWQVMREITLPLLAPGIFSGFTFAFLLSWANFPLSMLSSGADSTIPEWVSAKLQSGYTPQVPAVGTLTILAAAVVMAFGYQISAFMKRRQVKAG
ncbi:ABC transporter permease [Pararhizobium antarcticum]|uniref:Spermidine/putrescine ABC transporter permease n=1 Tax=Pararhizobium antarcticum TaxID=1798805 RepID=A0A657LRN7_9HYPH|nr:ABC transporter permease [Pararhizobium antarcticum]OJF94941.1 spermidine/putrescine ABC transporter permease [Pararhizobium antarcticum]OJF97443.1 spermidine/putrescine ABC transporter permease [Rhizobium sp. 58]